MDALTRYSPDEMATMTKFSNNLTMRIKANPERSIGMLLSDEQFFALTCFREAAPPSAEDEG